MEIWISFSSQESAYFWSYVMPTYLDKHAKSVETQLRVQIRAVVLAAKLILDFPLAYNQQMEVER